MRSRVHPQGWISVPIAPEHEERAKQIRAERDLRYGNIYDEAETDERWVGDLGELTFKSWLKHEKVEGFEWVLDDAAGQPDFLMPKGARIGAKTVKRKVPPRADYTAQITACHAQEPIDHYFFMTYEIDKRLMWLLGGIEQERFLAEARYYAAGEWVHPHYQVRQGHEIYNIGIATLVRPKEWLGLVV